MRPSAVKTYEIDGEEDMPGTHSESLLNSSFSVPTWSNSVLQLSYLKMVKAEEQRQAQELSMKKKEHSPESWHDHGGPGWSGRAVDLNGT